MHESLRVFYDRLVDDGDRAWLVEFIREAVGRHLDDDFDDLFRHYDSDRDGKVHEDDLRSLMFCDFGNDHRLYVEALDLQQLNKACLTVSSSNTLEQCLFQAFFAPFQNLCMLRRFYQKFTRVCLLRACICHVTIGRRPTGRFE